MSRCAAAVLTTMWLLRTPAVSAFAFRVSKSSCRSLRPLYAGTRAHRKERRTTIDNESGALEWEHFDFSQNPKWDKRFDKDATEMLNKKGDWKDLVEDETKQDEQQAYELNRKSTIHDRLDPAWVQQATELLSPFIQEERLKRMNEVLEQRTQNCRFLFENPANPSNVFACLRTIDSFGIQHVDIVVESGKYLGKAAISQKRGMRTAMGSAQWLTLRNHPSTKEAVQTLKDEGYRLLASDLNPDSKDVRDVQWSTPDDDRPICIVMGNENLGISQEMREMVDETFTLPMYGFAESFNLSVATAITLAHLSACSKGNGRGPLRSGDLDPHQVNCMRLRGILNSLSQKKVAKAVLRKHGVDIPPEMDQI